MIVVPKAASCAQIGEITNSAQVRFIKKFSGAGTRQANKTPYHPKKSDILTTIVS